jgi:glucosylglycerate phosphorylase
MLRERLQFLYGAEVGQQAYADLERLLESFRRRLPAVAAHGPRFTEADAVLIAYGDTLLQPGVPPLRALEQFASRHLHSLVSTIHILPFFPYSSDYGFSVIDYLAVNPALGDWDDVGALHRRFKLMFDFVLNHISAESGWFQAFLRSEPPYDQFFIVADPSWDLSGVTRPRTSPVLTRVETAAGLRQVWTTFSADQVDLNWANPDVLVRMIEVLLTYVERGADLVRMDAVGYLWKEVGTSCIHQPRTHEMVRLFREVLDRVAPQVAIVTETNVPHVDNVAYFGNGSDEAQMVYQFPLAPLVLDAFSRGEASHLAAWAANLSVPSDSTTFFNFLASHDGIGVVPARGLLSDAEVDRLAEQTLRHGGQVSYKSNPDGSESPYELNITFFDALSDPADSSEGWTTKLERFACSQAILLALAGVPGIYIHSLFGSHSDQEGYRQSGWKRDLNHERLQLGLLERRLADRGTETAQVFQRYARLLAVRRAQPAFHPAAPQQVLDLDEAVFGLRRGPRNGQVIVALHNVSGSPRPLDPRVLGIRRDQQWEDLLAERLVDPGQPLVLAPYGQAWLACRGFGDDN